MLAEIRGLWIGERLSPFERLCIRSFLDHGHPFRLFTYGEVAGIPEGTEVEDGRAILPRRHLEPFLAPHGSLAHFADWFRWELLRVRGGWWVDMDLICLAPFVFDQPLVFGYQDPFSPAIGALRFPADHPVPRIMVDRCADPARFRPGDSLRRKLRKTFMRLSGGVHSRLRWGEAGGPDGFREAIQGTEWAESGLPFTVFYPVHHQHWPHLFDDVLKDDLPFYEETVAVHLWNELFRKFFPKDRNASFHEDSVFEQLRRRHLPGG